jgi:hypothetical protein
VVAHPQIHGNEIAGGARANTLISEHGTVTQLSSAPRCRDFNRLTHSPVKAIPLQHSHRDKQTTPR